MNIKDLIKNKSLIDDKYLTYNNDLKIYNPANNKIIASIKPTEIDDLDNIIINSSHAQQNYKNTIARYRSDLLYKWYSLIIENREDLATIITIEQGKPISESLSEVDIAAYYIRWFSCECERIYGKTIPSKNLNQKIIVEYEPVGVIYAITPWNFPISMLTRKAAPAIASGCSIIIKPSELTPLSAIAIKKLAIDAGIDDNLIQIVIGDASDISSEIINNKIVKKISFTGSTNIGKLLIKQCANTVKRMSMELGGNAPFIIFSDADKEKSIDDLIKSKFRNNGQTCICANRIFIEESIYDEYLIDILDKISKLTIGNGLDDVDIGPIISEKQLSRIENLVSDAINSGASILCGGSRIDVDGNYFKPTIIELSIDSDCLISTEEIFGPILVLYKFRSDNEVIKLANNTNSGLAAYLYTKDRVRIEKMTKVLEYGMIGVNECSISIESAPFGGIKESGFGREGSYLGIEEYLNIKYILYQY